MNHSSDKKLRRRLTVAETVAMLGFLLTLTELSGGPWAGTYAGAATLVLSFLCAVRTRYQIQIEGRKTKHEIHLRVYRRPAGRDDAA